MSSTIRARFLCGQIFLDPADLPTLTVVAQRGIDQASEPLEHLGRGARVSPRPCKSDRMPGGTSVILFRKRFSSRSPKGQAQHEPGHQVTWRPGTSESLYPKVARWVIPAGAGGL